jgi:hypothetical protein
MNADEKQRLLAEIDAYCDAAGIRPATLTSRALNDGNTYKRLSAGGRCWPETMAKIRAYMAANPLAHTVAGASGPIGPAPERDRAGRADRSERADRAERSAA